MKFLVVIGLCIVGAYAAPLSLDEAEIVKSTWSQISHHEVEILLNFFALHPEHQALFPALNGNDLAAIKESPLFAIHASRFV